MRRVAHIYTANSMGAPHLVSEMWVSTNPHPQTSGITAMQVGSATVITSIASTAMNLPIVNRQIKVNAVKREILLATVLQAVAGSAVLLSERWFLR